MTTTQAGLWAGTALTLLGSIAAAQEATTLTIATVNNPDMIRMQALTDNFTETHPEIEVEWVTLEENVLRQNVTTDIATGGGQYDIITIGTYEVPIWGAKEWLVPLDDLPAEYDVDDILPPIRAGLSVDGTLYAVPFYGESSFTIYRTDLLEAAGLEMPDAPTWDFVAQAAKAMNDPENGVYGICLRGKPGWGENMAFIGTLANSLGARWFDENWEPQLDSPEWKATMDLYLDLMTNYGPAGASASGVQESLTLFQQGRCGIMIDATSMGSSVLAEDTAMGPENVGFALAPDAGLGKRANWLWAWSLAVPSSSNSIEEAKTFVEWATNKEYTELVAETEGWGNVPPGTRTSLYENPEYLKVPFAQMTLDAINSADPNNPTVDPVPYTGVQFVAIPEFQSIGTSVGQEFAAALVGDKTGEEALAAAQASTEQAMQDAGYIQ